MLSKMLKPSRDEFFADLFAEFNVVLSQYSGLNEKRTDPVKFAKKLTALLDYIDLYIKRKTGRDLHCMQMILSILYYIVFSVTRSSDCKTAFMKSVEAFLGQAEKDFNLPSDYSDHPALYLMVVNLGLSFCVSNIIVSNDFDSKEIIRKSNVFTKKMIQSGGVKDKAILRFASFMYSVSGYLQGIVNTAYKKRFGSEAQVLLGLLDIKPTAVLEVENEIELSDDLTDQCLYFLRIIYDCSTEAYRALETAQLATPAYSRYSLSKEFDELDIEKFTDFFTESCKQRLLSKPLNMVEGLNVGLTPYVEIIMRLLGLISVVNKVIDIKLPPESRVLPVEGSPEWNELIYLLESKIRITKIEKLMTEYSITCTNANHSKIKDELIAIEKKLSSLNDRLGKLQATMQKSNPDVENKTKKRRRKKKTVKPGATAAVALETNVPVIKAMPIPPYLEIICNKLIERNHKVYVVGGAVRDFLTGYKEMDDYDLVTTAPFEEIEKILTEHGGSLIRSNHPVFLIPGNAKEHEKPIQVRPMMSSGHSEKYESMVLENETTIYLYLTELLSDDALHRDFKFNAIYFSLKSRKYKDPLNGLKDIEGKTISFVSDNVYDTVSKDPSLIIRLIRTLAKTQFTISPGVEDIIKVLVPKLAKLKSSKLNFELEKSLQMKERLFVLDKLIEYKVFESLFYSDRLQLDKCHDLLRIMLSNDQYRFNKSLLWAIISYPSDSTKFDLMGIYSTPMRNDISQVHQAISRGDNIGLTEHQAEMADDFRDCMEAMSRKNSIRP